MKIKAGARSSPLSKAQFEEIREELKKRCPHVELEPVWAQSPGDRDRKTSLKSQGISSDFFTRDLDLMLLDGTIRLAIHSAKDLPDPLPKDLALVFLTPTIDSRDSLVFRKGESLQTLRSNARIATSSLRREEAVKKLRSDLVFCDLRGTIEERLLHLEERKADGIVIAEAALIRLKLIHYDRIFLPGETAPLQGRLAVLSRADDTEVRQLCRKILYLGIDAPPGVFHYPVIRTARIDSPELRKALLLWDRCTHAIFTSKNGVRHWQEDLRGKIIIAIGKATAEEIRIQGVVPLVAPETTQEGVVHLLETLDLKEAFILYPRSALARPYLTEFLDAKKIKHYAFDLYEPVFQRPEPEPDLADFDEIVFTSPSTVQAFCRIFSSVPQHIDLTPIGPITKKALEEYIFPKVK